MNIHDLARHLNVSIGTVSRALNGRADVSAETRKRVLEAARKLGYSPNQSGRSLRSGTTGMIGFMIIVNRARLLRGEAFFMTIFDGLQTALSRHNMDLVVYYCSEDQDPEAYVRRIIERRFVDGLIISQVARIDPRIDYLRQHDVPFLAFGRSQSGGDHCWVDLDFEGEASDAVDRFVAKGHTRFAVVTTSGDLNFGGLYLDACRKALGRHGLTLDDRLVFREPMTEAGGYKVGSMLLEANERPTAVLAVDRLLAFGLRHRFQEAGPDRGGDIEVIGFDDAEEAGRSATLHHALHSPYELYQSALTQLGVWMGETILTMVDAKVKGKPQPRVAKVWPMRSSVVAAETEAGKSASTRTPRNRTLPDRAPARRD